MAYRDVLFGPLTSVFVVSGLSPDVIAALRGGFEQVARTRRSARLRWSSDRAHGSVRTAGELAALIDRNIRTADESTPNADLIEIAHSTILSGLPIALAIAGDQCAVVFAHRVFDGTGSMQLIHDLLDASSGELLAAEAASARFPALQALRQVRPGHVRRFIDARRNRPTSPAEDPSTASPRATSAALSLSAADLGAVRRYRKPERVGRATLLSRIASLIVAALREVATSDVDIPV